VVATHGPQRLGPLPLDQLDGIHSGHSRGISIGVASTARKIPSSLACGFISLIVASIVEICPTTKGGDGAVWCSRAQRWLSQCMRMHCVLITALTSMRHWRDQWTRRCELMQIVSPASRVAPLPHLVGLLL
jgi:hypothetical protein